MTLWQPIPPSIRAQEALQRLAAPSGPQPLHGSLEIEPNHFLVPMTPAEAQTAYQQVDSPIPPGTTVRVEAEGILVVEAPFRTSGIFFHAHKDGCIYTITPGPSLTIQGGGERVPNGAAFCRVAPWGMGESIYSIVKLQGALWVIHVGADIAPPKPTGVIRKITKAVPPTEEDQLRDEKRIMEMGRLLAEGKIAEVDQLLKEGQLLDPPAPVTGPATIERSANGAITARIDLDTSVVEIKAFYTDSPEWVMSTFPLVGREDWEDGSQDSGLRELLETIPDSFIVKAKYPDILKTLIDGPVGTWRSVTELDPAGRLAEDYQSRSSKWGPLLVAGLKLAWTLNSPEDMATSSFCAILFFYSQHDEFWLKAFRFQREWLSPSNVPD
jgi:hypothetical protein